MKAVWFMPFTYAAGAEGFALFLPYLIAMLAVVYFVRAYRQASAAAAPVVVPARVAHTLDAPLDIQPAI